MYTEFNGASSSIDARFAVIYFLMTCNEREFSQYMQAMEVVRAKSIPADNYRAIVRAWGDAVETGRADPNDMLKALLPPSMIAGPDHPYFAH